VSFTTATGEMRGEALDGPCRASDPVREPQTGSVSLSMTDPGVQLVKERQDVRRRSGMNLVQTLMKKPKESGGEK
jgi:hypothetical protein